MDVAGEAVRGNAHTRKKQPEVIRRALLDNAAQLAVAHGISGVTVKAVADAAGVTKGGLFHHFPSKQALVDGMFSDLLETLDAQIDGYMAVDDVPQGRFTRAYVSAFFETRDFRPGTLWGALSMAMLSEPSLRDLWAKWMRDRLDRHGQTDGTPMLEIVRLAADGAWLTFVTGEQAAIMPDIQGLRERLLVLTLSETY